MKKIATLFIAVLLFISCGQQQKKEVKLVPYSELLQYADSFVITHPNMLDNEVIEEKAGQEFQHYCKKNFIQDTISPTNGVVVKLWRLIKRPKSMNSKDEYQAVFTATRAERNLRDNGQDIGYTYSIHLNVCMPESIAIGINDKKKYHVYGRVINEKPNCKGFWANENPLLEGVKNFHLGTWWIDNPVIIPVEE